MLFFTISFITHCVKQFSLLITSGSEHQELIQHDSDSSFSTSSDSNSNSSNNNLINHPDTNTPHKTMATLESHGSSDAYNTTPDKHSVSFAADSYGDDSHVTNGHSVEITHTPASPLVDEDEDIGREPVAAKRQSGGESGGETAEDFIKYEERKLIERLSNMMDKEFATQTTLADSHPQQQHQEVHHNDPHHEVSSIAESDNSSSHHVVTAQTHEPERHHEEEDEEEEERQTSVDDFLEHLNEKVAEVHSHHLQEQNNDDHHHQPEHHHHEEPAHDTHHASAPHEEVHHHQQQQQHHEEAVHHQEVHHKAEETFSHVTETQHQQQHEYSRTDSQSSFTIGAYGKTNGDRNNNNTSAEADEEEGEDEFNEIAGFKNKLNMWSNKKGAGGGAEGVEDPQISSADKFKTLRQIRKGNTRNLMERFQIPK